MCVRACVRVCACGKYRVVEERSYGEVSERIKREGGFGEWIGEGTI